MRAVEGSLDAPENTKADASRKLYCWKIPEDAGAGGNRILIDGSAGDARFGGNKECIRGSAGEGITQRKLNDSRPVKPDGETADENRRRSLLAGRGQQPAQVGAAQPAEPKDGADASRGLIVGLAGGEIVRRESKGSSPVGRKSGIAGASRRYAAGRAYRYTADPSCGVGHRWSRSR